MEFHLHKKQGEILKSKANEILYGGAAGGGKSHMIRVLSILICCQVPSVQVYLFRRLSEDLYKNHVEGVSGYYAMLDDLIQRKKAKITNSPTKISFWNGAKIHLCHCQYEKDVYKYQGAEINVLLMDELTHFTRFQYVYLRGRVRVPISLKIPESLIIPFILCGTNPGNVGHNWVKSMFIDPAKSMDIHKAPASDGGMNRQYIPAMLADNPSLNQEEYAMRLQGLGNPALVEAMLNGNWDIIAGGMFDDVYNKNAVEVEPFDIPSSWYIDRSFDWGSSKPYSVGWWAESDGTDVTLKDGTTKATVRGDLYRINELYGWNGTPNEGTKELAVDVAVKIKEIESVMNLSVNPGAADSSIYTEENGNCIADDMEKAGIKWTRANKKPGSRANGWEIMRKLLKGSGSNEEPGLYSFSNCRQFIRTIPVMPRDKKKPDDVDTDSEDHIADEARYRVLDKKSVETTFETGLLF